jgi:GxxExxY protein
MPLKELTSVIIGCAIKVHRTLSPGLLEPAYRACLAYELRKLGHHVETEKPIPLIYEEVKLDCGFRADLLVDGQVIVECKAKEKMHPVDKAQVVSHLRILGLQVGLLINFHDSYSRTAFIPSSMATVRTTPTKMIETQRAQRTQRQDRRETEESVTIRERK